MQLTAQQLPQTTQYLLNAEAYNPAITGTKDYYSIKLNGRHQWIGIDGAPKTYMLTVNSPIKTKRSVAIAGLGGLGGYIFNDVTGFISRTGISFTYAYHLPLGKDRGRISVPKFESTDNTGSFKGRKKMPETVKLSMGLSAGFLQYKTDVSQFHPADETDPKVDNMRQTALTPDVSFGLYLYTGSYHLGLSVLQLIPGKLNFFDNSSSRLNQHYVLTGSYKYPLNWKFDIEPSFLIKTVAPNLFHADISSRLIFNNKFWIGASYRTYDAVAFLAGVNYYRKLFIGYSYDLTTSNLKNYSTGTHEIMLDIAFDRIYIKVKTKEKDVTF